MNMIDRFVSFFLFDSHFDEKDQSPGDIIYFQSKDDQLNQDTNLRYIATGVITTINAFCRLFGENCCDYMITSNCENAFLPIGEDLYFYLTLKLPSKQPNVTNIASQMMPNLNLGLNINLTPFHICATNTRKMILKNVLVKIKQILFLSVQQPKRDSKGKFTDIFKKEVNTYLPKILDLIDWNNLSYTNIWRSNVFIAKLPKMMNIKFLDELRTLQSQNEFIYGLILTNKNQIVAYTTDQDLANILNLLVKKRYKVYFPYKLKKNNNNIHWIIGIINHENGCIENKGDTDDFMSVVTPPLFWKGQTFALVALKFNMVKLIAIIDLKNVDLENDLNNFKTLAKPILRKCDYFNDDDNADFESLKDDIDSRFKKNPGVKLSCNFQINSIQILANRIMNNEMDLIVHGIFFSNEANLFIRKELMKNNDSKSGIDRDASKSGKFNEVDIYSNNNNNNVDRTYNTEGLFPFYSGFSLYFEQRSGKYSNIYMKTKKKNMSGFLELFHMTDEII